MYVCQYVLLESHEAEASGDHMDQNVRNLEKNTKNRSNAGYYADRVHR